LYRSRVGTLLVLIGFILIALGFLFLSLGAEVKGGGIILIGPIPIVFGGGTIALVVIFLMLTFLAFILLSALRGEE